MHNLHDIETVKALDKLQQSLPQLIETYPADYGEILDRFAAGADQIEFAAKPADQKYVRGRLDRMLRAEGLMPNRR